MSTINGEYVHLQYAHDTSSSFMSLPLYSLPVLSSSSLLEWDDERFHSLSNGRVWNFVPRTFGVSLSPSLSLYPFSLSLSLLVSLHIFLYQSVYTRAHTQMNTHILTHTNEIKNVHTQTRTYIHSRTHSLTTSPHLPSLHAFAFSLLISIYLPIIHGIFVCRERGLTPTPGCYAVALNALEKEAEWQKAVNLLLQVSFSNPASFLIVIVMSMDCRNFHLYCIH